MGKTNSNSNYKAKLGSLKSPQKKANNYKNSNNTQTQNKKPTYTNNNASYQKMINEKYPQKKANNYQNANTYKTNSNIASIKKGQNLTNVNTPIQMYNIYNNQIETLDVETGSIEKLKVDIKNINLERISVSAQNALNSNFVKVNEDIWNKAELNITEREDGTFLIKNGEVPIGFTDAKGLETLLNPKEENNAKATNPTNNNETQAAQTNEEKQTNEQNPTQTQTTEETIKEEKQETIEEKKYTQTEETGFNGGGFKLDSGKKLETVYKIIAAEGGNISTDEAKNIASTLINRAREGHGYNAKDGSDIYDVATAPGQFSVYESEGKGLYTSATLNEESRKAVDELFASCAEGGETTHDYKFYRSNNSKWYGGEILTPGGNRYGYR